MKNKNLFEDYELMDGSREFFVDAPVYKKNNKALVLVYKTLKSILEDYEDFEEIAQEFDFIETDGNDYVNLEFNEELVKFKVNENFYADRFIKAIITSELFEINENEDPVKVIEYMVGFHDFKGNKGNLNNLQLIEEYGVITITKKGITREIKNNLLIRSYEDGEYDELAEDLKIEYLEKIADNAVLLYGDIEDEEC